MNIEISKELVEAIGVKVMKAYGVNEDKIRWSGTSINLTNYSNQKIKQLRELIVAKKAGMKGANAAIRDIDIWIKAAEVGAENVKCKNTKHFSALVFEYLQKKAPMQRLYKKDDDRDVWVAYYVGDVTFHEKQQRLIPAHTDLRLFYLEIGVQESEKIEFEDPDVAGRTVPEALNAMGYVIQTDELLADYQAHFDRYVQFHDKLGMQFLAVGVGTDDLDGSSYWHSTQKFFMERGGEPSRVVVDVPQESDKKERGDSDRKFNPRFWSRKSLIDKDEDVDDNDLHPGDEDEDEGAIPDINVPVFPMIPCFDLKRHLRLKIHIGNLTEYRYDKSLGDKLILPADSKALVNMLLAHSGGWKDIIGGKSGGAIILCAGSPGTGKTLTAEVYAEVMERALYSVQCSQLGTDPEELEGSLMKSFARAQRWNAILLLDEADVYVTKRGSDLQQNAIVGVFLRVLEYYQGVLFLTTNRADLVDDAIASRCIARIDYRVPVPDDQKRIWEVLSKAAGIEVPTAAISAMIERHPNLSGRDVKNLLKLARLVALSHNTPITVEILEYVKRFKPTEDVVPGGGE